MPPTQNRPTPPNNYNGNNTRPLYDSNNIRNHHQDWRFVSPSRNRLSDPGIEKDIRKRARAITWKEKCVDKHLKRDPSQRRDADYLKQPTFQYKHCSVAVIKDDVTLSSKRTHGTTDEIMSEKSPESPAKINNTNIKELSEEAETRKLNDETKGDVYPLPNITIDSARIQKQGSTNFVNVSNIIRKEIASVSPSNTSIKPSESNFIEVKVKPLNSKKTQTIENKSITIPKPKTESIRFAKRFVIKIQRIILNLLKIFLNVPYK